MSTKQLSLMPPPNEPWCELGAHLIVFVARPLLGLLAQLAAKRKNPRPATVKRRPSACPRREFHAAFGGWTWCQKFASALLSDR